MEREGISDMAGKAARVAVKAAGAADIQFFEKARPSSLLKRFATPDEVAAMVVFICSPLSSATNGAALRVDGGVVRSPF